MLEKIIKQKHVKIIFSFYGILGIFTALLPLAMLAMGIYFMVSKVNNYGFLWTAVGAIALLFSLKRLKDFIPIYKYAFKPKKYPAYQKMLEDGIDPSQFDAELEEANILEKLDKNNPLVITENFVFGYSQASFFFLYKEDIIWAYEYNGNGLVLYDNHKIYGFTFFPTVDGNTEAVNLLRHEIPYIYFGIDFDYKLVMHEQFAETCEELEAERAKFLANPDEYREEKERLEKEKTAEAERKLEEERQAQMAKIEDEENTNQEENLVIDQEVKEIKDEEESLVIDEEVKEIEDEEKDN